MQLKKMTVMLPAESFLARILSASGWQITEKFIGAGELWVILELKEIILDELHK